MWGFDAAKSSAETHELPMSLAHVCIAMGESSQAMEQLAPLHDRLAANNLNRDLLKVLVLESIAQHALEDDQKSMVYLQQAFALAESGENIRVFLDEGQALKKVLEKQTKKGLDVFQPNAKKLLTAFNLDKLEVKEKGLPDQLSQREMEVLEYIAAGLSNQKISEVLFVSMNTIKTHIRNIYIKLDANSRTKAVAKAQELGLL